MKLYDVEALRFDYPGRFRLEIDELGLEEGERLAVVGRNGSGKTTLLRLLAFLERPRSWNRFRYRGREVRPGWTPRRGLGFLRQQPWIFRGSVNDNLAYGLQVRGVPRREIDSRVGAMCERLRLTGLRDAPARSLSGGEQKRVALGRLLVTEPEVLLLDEPTAHLDRISREITEEILTESRAALLATTHDLPLALRLSRRVLTLEGGRVCSQTPVNLLEGRCAGDVLTTRGGLAVRLPRWLETGRAVAAVDPQAIVLSLDPLPSSMRNVFAGTIVSARVQGENMWVEIDAGEVLTAVISRASYARLELNLGREVIASFKANAVQALPGGSALCFGNAPAAPRPGAAGGSPAGRAARRDSA